MTDRPGVFGATARPSRCFGRAARLTRRPIEALLTVALSTGGTAVASWVERAGPNGSLRWAFASGRAGGSFGGRRELPRRNRAGVLTGAVPSFMAGDRVVWNAVYGRDGDSGFEFATFAATSAPRAGRLGAFRRIGAGRLGTSLTDRRGGQVAASDSPGGALHIYARAPGRPFRQPRSIPTTHGMARVAEAGNASGDTAFLLSDEQSQTVVIRRRNGRVIGPVPLRNAHGLTHVHAYPDVAIDRAGRVVVAWIAQNAAANDLAPGEVQVASSDRAGRFGRVKTVSGARRDVFDEVNVAVNGSGRAAVAYQKVDLAPVGVVGYTSMLVRGRR